MSAALLDTNAISDLMGDHPKIKVRVGQHSDLIGTSVVVVGEIQYGLDRLPVGKKRTDLEARAQSVLSLLPIDAIAEPIAQTFGGLKAGLERQGLVFGDNDLWIAATALTLGRLLVTRDHLYSQIPNLQVEDWTT